MAKTKKGGAKKAAAPILNKLGKKAYTKGQLINHLAIAVSSKGFGDVSKKQAGAFVEELSSVLFTQAPVGAPLPVGSVVAQLVASARACGDGDLDHSALLRGVERLAGRDNH